MNDNQLWMFIFSYLLFMAGVIVVGTAVYLFHKYKEWRK